MSFAQETMHRKINLRKEGKGKLEMKHLIKRRYEILRKLRWLARVVSSVVIIGLIIVLVEEGFGNSKFNSREWIGFLYFPIGTILGFIFGWKYEITGGLISIVSLTMYFFSYSIRVLEQIPNLAVFGVFLIPAMLFVISGIYAYFAIGGLDDRVSNQAIKH